MTDKQVFCYWLAVANRRGCNALKSRAMVAINKARAEENKEKKIEKACKNSPLIQHFSKSCF